MTVSRRANHYIEPQFREEMLHILFEPITVGNLKLKNRILFAPVQTLPPENVWPDMHQTHIIFHEAIARGGASMIVVGESDVTPNSEGALQAAAGERRPTKGIWADEAIPGWVKLIDACHKHGAKVIPQLSSYAPWRPRIAGVRGEGSTELIVPSWKEIGMTPEVLEEEKWNFVSAALRAMKAGADGVQLAGTRESLIASMVSAMRNPGVPGYSEGLKERVRFPVECIREIKAACGKDFPVMIRLTPVEYIAGGYDIDYAKLVAREYVDAGIDLIDVAQAGFSTQVPQLQMVAPIGMYAYHARTVKSFLSSLGAPYSQVVITNACRIQNPWLAASLIRNGDCDAVSICRQLFIDPDWPTKIREGRIDDIVPCIGCGWCLRSYTCAVNPQSPFYKSADAVKTLTMTKASKVKTVIVAGGGLAGMESAMTLALRGHKVTLYEKEKNLGRMIYVQSLAPFRTDVDLLREYLSTQIKKLGVDIRYNQEVTATLVQTEKPDVVIVATGCRPKLPKIVGIDKHPHVVFAEDVLLEAVGVGEKVLVIDADLGYDFASLGSFTAQFVARSASLRDDVAMHVLRWSPQHSSEQVNTMANTPIGREVTIVTTNDRVADVQYHHYTTMQELRRLGVKVLVECEYKEINDKGLVLVHNGKEQFIEADTIITSNYEPNDDLYKQLTGKVGELYIVGDARGVQVQFIGSVHGPYRLALKI
jgi:2,4-dienoyl-CoA reductase-like NADH-dependent reductase (Old Yellow Enzyme family)/thioredoxin reductase